ncbi:MAG: hypothetical protein U9O18_07710, partial [Chloroflexota bacterium]|nr:hypothetical protein [Chloroflexota bacterium]
LRVAVAAILLAVVGVGLWAGLAVDPPAGPAAPATDQQSPQPTPSELFSVTLDEDALPENLVGILFSRKAYPTDKEITYTAGFKAPNTFIRYLEAGELGIRPKSSTQIIRAGSSWNQAEVLAPGEETIVGTGDTFVMHEIPFDEFGPQALGEMWTPGDDATVISLAIRETKTCCAMTHPGMESIWYSTLSTGVDELRDDPVTLRVLRWEIPVGATSAQTVASLPTLWVLDSGAVSVTPATGASEDAYQPPDPKPGSPLWLLSLDPGAEMIVENVGDEPAVLYQLLVTPADPVAGSAATAEITVMDAGRMLKGRSGHEATLLPDGRVLITGGGWADAETFDPASGSFESVGKMSGIRSATATLLEGGCVLLAGGGSQEAEVFDPTSGTFETTGTMLEERGFHAATRLADGRVLITGGRTDSAELYDPETGVFEPTGEMLGYRAEHAAVLLADGRVLVSGGGAPPAELYDPASGTFGPTDAAFLSRDNQTSTLLGDGRVLLVGHGAGPQIYDPVSDSVEAAGPMLVPRYHHAAALMPDGRVVLLGGLDQRVHDPIASIEIFDPVTNTFSDGGAMTVVRWYPTATTLPDGRIFVAGGTTGTAAMRNTETLELTAPR